MSGADGYIRINTKLDTSGMNNGLSKVTASLSKLAGAMGVAFGAKAVIDFGRQCLESAANVKAIGSQFEQTFSGVQAQAEAAIQGVASISGILESRLQSVGTQIYAFARTTGMQSSDALGLMERALTVTADSAAYYDRSLENTAESLQSFLKGNYENDAALGLSCTETTRNAKANELYGKSFADLSESQKQFVLLSMVEDANALSGALGQAAREADGWENVTGNLTESMRQLMAVIGQPVLAAAIPVVQSLSAGMSRLSQSVQDGYDAIAAWTRTVDFSPLNSAVNRLKSALSKLFSELKKSAGTIAMLVKPFLKWIIETALPAAANALSGIVSVVRVLAALISPVIRLICSGITAVIDGVKTLVTALSRLFGIEPPAWALEPTELFSAGDSGGAEDAAEETDDLTDSYDDLADSAGDAGDAIEDAEDAADGGGSGGSGNSKVQRDILGFDQITKLSDQSGSSSGSGGSGGSGGSAGSGSGTGTGTGTGSGSAGASPASEYTDPKISQGVEQLGNQIDELKLHFDDLNLSIDNTSKKLLELGKNKTASITLRLLGQQALEEALKELCRERTADITAKLRSGLIAQELAALALPRTASLTLHLVKGSGFDDLKSQWDNIRDSSALKELKTKLEVELRAAVSLAVSTCTQQQTTIGRRGNFGSGHGGGFTKDRGSSFGGGNGGSLNEGRGGGFGKSGTNSVSVLDKVKDWWNSLKKGKATKTIDLKGSGSGSRSFSGMVKQWLGITDGKATKTLESKPTGKYTSALKGWQSWGNQTITKTNTAKVTGRYTSYQKNWQSWSSQSVTKTADGKATGKYTSYQKNWSSWVSGTITKTADSSQSGKYTRYHAAWQSWVNGTVIKTADGAQSGRYTSYRSAWSNWSSGTITKKLDGSRTAKYTNYRSAWSNWSSQTVTKTANAETGKRWSSVKSQWDGMKDKHVTATLTLSATVKSMKSWLNSNVISPLNRAIHVVFPGVSIPRLATGGVVNHATMAMVGEAGREAVLPLDRNTSWMDELARRIGAQSGNAGQLTIEVHVGSERLTRQVVSDINNETRRTGTCPIYV